MKRVLGCMISRWGDIVSSGARRIGGSAEFHANLERIERNLRVRDLAHRRESSSAQFRDEPSPRQLSSAMIKRFEIPNSYRTAWGRRDANATGNKKRQWGVWGVWGTNKKKDIMSVGTRYMMQKGGGGVGTTMRKGKPRKTKKQRRARTSLRSTHTAPGAQRACSASSARMETAERHLPGSRTGDGTTGRARRPRGSAGTRRPSTRACAWAAGRSGGAGRASGCRGASRSGRRTGRG